MKKIQIISIHLFIANLTLGIYSQSIITYLFNNHKFLFLENTWRRAMSVTTDSLIAHNESGVNAIHGSKRPMLDDSNENEAKIQKTETEAVQRIKRKNHVIMLGYLGKDYYGMQRNPGMKTIEEDLITALLKADLITTEHFENIRAINFQRAARTDKGVSAIRQIVSLKLRKIDQYFSLNSFIFNKI